jgi:N-methylhydantoinase A/oxoprolinase/acetone carboxylase beta subunit
LLEFYQVFNKTDYRIQKLFYCYVLAYGMALADVEYEQQEACSKPLNEETMKYYIQDRIDHLKNLCKQYLVEKEKFSESNITMKAFLNIRYKGTDTGIMVCILMKLRNMNF